VLLFRLKPSFQRTVRKWKYKERNIRLSRDAGIVVSSSQWDFNGYLNAGPTVNYLDLCSQK